MLTKRPAGVGDAAPDLMLLDHDGADVRLSAYWKVQPTAFIFLRHFG